MTVTISRLDCGSLTAGRSMFERGEVVLAADCAYFTTTLDGGPLPPIGHDHAEHAASLERLRAMKAAGSVVIPGHDRLAFDGEPWIGVGFDEHRSTE